MDLNSRAIVSIVQLFIYTPLSLVSIFLLFHHGIRRTKSWLWLVLFILIKITGAILLLIVGNKTDASNSTSAYILMLGLFFVSAGSQILVSIAVALLDLVLKELPTMRNKPISLIFHTVVGAGIILITIGDFQGLVPGKQGAETSLHLSGGVTLLLAFVAFLVLICYAWSRSDSYTKQHYELLSSITFATIFLTVRIAYPLGDAFGSQIMSPFSFLPGSFATYLAMNVIMEIIIAGIFIWVGISHYLYDKTKEFPIKDGDSRLFELRGNTVIA